MGKGRKESSCIHTNQVACLVHDLDIGARKTCTFCTDHAVPKICRGNHVSGVHGEFKRIIDQVTHNSDTNADRVFFLWTMIDENSAINDCLAGSNVTNFFGGKE